jgi:predicted amidohydrolase YtcJ
MQSGQSQSKLGKMTVYRARKIITMCDTMPTAEAVAVANGKIVSVGTMKSLKPWLDRYPHETDDRFKDKVLMPGLVDPHVHPSLPAVVTQFPFLAPDDWNVPTGKFPGAKTPEAYVARLKELYAQHTDWKTLPFICWGFHPLWHGDQYRPASAQPAVPRQAGHPLAPLVP